MSYPRQIQTLIIEDDPEPVENYRSFFAQLAEKVEMADPIFARSHQEGLNYITAERIFHLIIIDLGLPQVTRGHAQPGVDPGIDLVQRALQRDHFPVPCLLVVTGRSNQVREMSGLADILREFWFGALANKPFFEEEVKKAIGMAQKYTDIGIHVRDSKEKLRPTLSPREDDLLRRCALNQVDCIGLDVEWWGHSTSFSGRFIEKKILAGRFVLGNARGTSRPSFFKFENSNYSGISHHDAALMVHKLSHVKVCFAKTAGTRSLLVTQQVGNLSGYPISLKDLLDRELIDSDTMLSEIAREISDQLDSLCPSIEEEVVVKDILWKHHDLNAIASALSRYSAKLSDSASLELLRLLLNDNNRLWVKIRNCIHGDLNATNIAIEQESDGSYRAYIFDAEGVHRDVNTKDLATLEVTTLLYADADQTVVSQFPSIYRDNSLDIELADANGTFIRNALTMIRALRAEVAKLSEPRVYALTVYDCVMCQLGGLAVQSSQNRITQPTAAADLAERVAKWYLSFRE
jgi:CheY-like chemotaxis protein